jgi:hypothetical protein
VIAAFMEPTMRCQACSYLSLYQRVTKRVGKYFLTTEDTGFFKSFFSVISVHSMVKVLARPIQLSTLLYQPVSDRDRVLPVMTAATPAVMLRSLCHDQCSFHCIAQSDQAIAQFGRAVERFDLVLQVP